MTLGSRDKVVHFLNRAQQFLDGMGQLKEGKGNAAALLAVHSAISFSDAIRMHFTGQRGRGDDHSEAATALRNLCLARHADASGIKHLSWLLGKKTLIAYGDDRLDPTAHLCAAFLSAERFAAWVHRTFPEVTRKDLGHD